MPTIRWPTRRPRLSSTWSCSRWSAKHAAILSIPIGVPKQQRPRIRGHGAAVERRHDPPPLEAFKLDLFRRPLGRHPTPCLNLASV
jgi:hypothetical protein